MTELLRVARNVTDLPSAARFYEALGFAAAGAVRDDAALAACLGVARVRGLRLRRGAQALELTQCWPAGPRYPEDAGANDAVFQHIALVTADIEAACTQALGAGAVAISSDGPEKLPESSGGVTAWKFRDPDGHPLEFLQFPDAAKNTVSGYDHTAISVADVGRSVAFYAGHGFVQVASQVNAGPAQDRLDGLRNVRVDVVALCAKNATPHLELLHYRMPRGGVARAVAAHDVAADRIVLGGGDRLRLIRDPDGHFILLGYD